MESTWELKYRPVHLHKILLTDECFKKNTDCHRFAVSTKIQPLLVLGSFPKICDSFHWPFGVSHDKHIQNHQHLQIIQMKFRRRSALMKKNWEHCTNANWNKWHSGQTVVSTTDHRFSRLQSQKFRSGQLILNNLATLWSCWWEGKLSFNRE